MMYLYAGSRLAKTQRVAITEAYSQYLRSKTKEAASELISAIAPGCDLGGDKRVCLLFDDGPSERIDLP